VAQLFRESAKNRSPISLLGNIRVATPLSHTLWASSALLLLCTVTTWLAIGSYSRRETVSGQVALQGGASRIRSRVAGEVSSIHVKEGDRVAAGQLIATIATSTALPEGESLEKLTGDYIAEEVEISGARHSEGQMSSARAVTEFREQQQILQQQLNATEEQRLLSVEQVKHQEQLLSKYEALINDGYVTAIQVQQQRSELLSVRAAVSRLAVESSSIRRQIAELSANIQRTLSDQRAADLDYRKQISQLSSKSLETSASTRSAIVAPRAGVVQSVLVKEGETVVNGLTVAVTSPTDAPLEAELFVHSSAIGFVKEGANVALRYDAFPYQKFGLSRAQVSGVSGVPLSTAELRDVYGRGDIEGPAYRITAKIENQAVRLNDQRFPLRPGMKLQADLLLERRKMYQWVFDPIVKLTKTVQEEDVKGVAP